MVRFLIYTMMAFITAFVGVSWAARGFPTSTPARQTMITPLRPTMQSTFRDGSDEARERKRWESEHTARSDGDQKLDAIRLDALQSAHAYEMSPCDETMRTNLVAALTAYTRAWQKKLTCPRPMGVLMFCEKQLQEAAETFTTPLDLRVRAALHAAVEQKGIVTADFPADVRDDVRQFAGPGLWHDESPICLPRQQASANPVR
mgnify:FL=1|jgi:hypothetical protein